MTLSRTIAAIALSTAMAVGPLATAASARDWDRDGPGRGGPGHHDRDFDGRGGRGDWGREGYDGRRHYDHRGRNIALGAFATILGLAIASEAARDRGYDRY